MAFTLIQSDNFTRTNTVASANPGSVGNGWVDAAGSIYNIQTNQLQGISSNQSGYLSQILTRPSSEQAQDQRILINFPGGGQSNVAGSTVLGAVTRYQSGTGNHYEAVVLPSTQIAYLYKVAGGTRTQISSITCTGFDSTHSYSVNLDATGTNPTTLAFTLIDTTSAITRGTGTATDSETTLQNATGVSAVSCWSVSGGSGTAVLVTSVATYSQVVVASALQISGPSTGAVSTASSAFTVSANGSLSTSVTVALSDGSTGVFTPSSLTLSPGSATATFTYRPPANPATYTLTASGTGLSSGTASYQATGAPVPATALILTGPSGGTAGGTSTAFTVSANGTLSSAITVALSSSASGSFTPSSLTIASGNTATFTYSPTTSTTATLTASSSGLTSATSQFVSSNVQYNPANYTGTTPATFTPLFGAGGPIEARVLSEQKGWFDWAHSNGLDGRLIVTEMGIPNSSNPVTDPQASYSTETYNPGWENVMQQWYEAANRASVHVTAWNAGEWRVGLAAYLTDDGTHKALTHRATASSVIENNPGNGVYQRGVAFFGADASDAGPGGGLNRGHISEPGAAYYYASAGSFKALAARGIGLVRLATRWERFQPTLKAALDETEMKLLDACLAGAAANGIKILLDIHNYARYDTTPDGVNQNGVFSIGQNAPSSVGGTMTDCFVDLWTRLSTRYKNNAAIWGYDICNEPHDLPGGVSDWQNASRLTVEAIRLIDQNVYIAVEGYAYATVTNWVSTNGSTPWFTEVIPAGQTGAGATRNTDPKVLFNGHHYFDTTPNGNDGSYRSTGGGGYANEVTYATTAGWKQWTTSGYTAPATNNTQQTGFRTLYKNTFDTNPGVYSSPGNINGVVAGSNTITIPNSGFGIGNSMKIVCSTTADEGAMRRSLTDRVSRVFQMTHGIDAASSLTGMSNFNIAHLWDDTNTNDLLEVRIDASGSGYTTRLSIPGSGGATAVGTTVLQKGTPQIMQVVMSNTDYKLFLNGSTSPEVTLTSANTSKNIGGSAVGKFYGTQPLTMYYSALSFGNNATYYAPPNGGLLAASVPTPTVSLSSNTTTGTAPASLTLTATAQEPGGTIAKVDFYQGGTKIGTATSSPYTQAVSSLATGTYSFTAVATDSNTASATSNVVSVTVTAASVGGTTASVPSVLLALSATSNVVPGMATLTATPSTTSGYITLVEFYNSGSKIGQATATPWAFTQTALPAGSYLYSAKATDNSGNTATSTSQSFVVAAGSASSPTPPTGALTVTVTNPTPPAALTLSATAQAFSGASVQSVSFLQNGVVLATQTAAPYTYGVANLAAGSYVFTATVTDSNAVQITTSPQQLIITPVTIVTVQTGTGTPASASSVQEITENTQGTLLDIKQYVGHQWGRNDGNVPDPSRDSLINDARHAYYASRRWSFLYRNGFVLQLSVDSVYPTLYSATLPANRNRSFDLGAVYDSYGRPITKHTVDQLLLQKTFPLIQNAYAIDERRGVLITSINLSSVFADYWMLPRSAKLDGSEDLISEPAFNLTAIKYLAMSLNWEAGERDDANFNRWQALYESQYKMDVTQDAQNQAIRQFRQTPRNNGYSRRGGQAPPSGYISRYY